MNVEEKEINEKRKKIRSVVILVISLLCIIGFFAALSIWVEHNNLVTEQINEREEYERKYLKKLRHMNAIINMDALNEGLLESSWVKDRTVLPDTDVTVSLHALDLRIYAYKMITETDLSLTAEDIVSLYQTPNGEKQAEFNQFYDWYMDNSSKYDTYSDGIMAASRLYKSKYGHKYKEKDFMCLNAEECNELAKWAIENPDYTYTQEDSDFARYYASFLNMMGLCSEEDYPAFYLQRIIKIGVTNYWEWTIGVDETTEKIKTRIVLPDTDITVSLYEVDLRIYAYNMITGTDLGLTAEDVVSLYQTRNDKKEAKLNEFYKWYCYKGGSSKYSVYYNGVKAASRLYESKYGHKYKEKKFDHLTSGECAELAKWIIENPDYTYAQEDSDFARYYARFLNMMGLFGEKV